MHAIFSYATHPILGGTAAADAIDVWGIEGAARWDQGVLIRYRSRRDLMNLIVTGVSEQARESQNAHDYNVAGMEKTIAYPLDPSFYLGDPRLVFGLAFLVIGLALEVRRLRRSVVRNPIEFQEQKVNTTTRARRLPSTIGILRETDLLLTC
jgi:hypothetical protein